MRISHPFTVKQRETFARGTRKILWNLFPNFVRPPNGSSFRGGPTTALNFTHDTLEFFSQRTRSHDCDIQRSFPAGTETYLNPRPSRTHPEHTSKSPQNFSMPILSKRRAFQRIPYNTQTIHTIARKAFPLSISMPP